MPAPKQCYECKWFDRHETTIYGNCRVYPPEVMTDEHHALINHIEGTSGFTDKELLGAKKASPWPVVIETEFCSLQENITP